MNLADTKGRLAHWRRQLMKLKYKIVNCPVVTHQAAHAMSRMPTEEDDQTPLDDNVSVVSIINSTYVQREDQSVLYADNYGNGKVDNREAGTTSYDHGGMAQTCVLSLV